VKFQKLMWRNMMRSTKSQKVLILHYSIDMQNEVIKYIIGVQTFVFLVNKLMMHVF
jgi:hypothetical protein